MRVRSCCSLGPYPHPPACIVITPQAGFVDDDLRSRAASTSFVARSADGDSAGATRRLLQLTSSGGGGVASSSSSQGRALRQAGGGEAAGGSSGQRVLHLKPGEIGDYCIHPACLRASVERSLERLRLETVSTVIYILQLHLQVATGCRCRLLCAVCRLLVLVLSP